MGDPVTGTIGLANTVGGGGLGKPSVPPPPDYAGAAAAQGQANKEAATASAQASNPNINDPTGSQKVTWSKDPTTGNMVPTVDRTYAPGQQKIFEQNQQLQQLMGLFGIGAGQRAGDALSKPLDFNAQLGTPQQGSQDVINAMMGRYNTDFNKQKDQANSDLIARGIRPGTAAYETEMDRMNRGRNDALQQATIGADQQAMEKRRQAITELLAQRQTPLNEMNAFRSASQVNPLQFQNYTGSQVAPAPIFGAANAAGQYGTDVYNAQTGTYNSILQGLFGIGSAGAYGAAKSDRRLKSNIKRIGTHRLGIGIYEYDISGKRETGVMADEVLAVRPEAVTTHSDGYYMVNYGML